MSRIGLPTFVHSEIVYNHRRVNLCPSRIGLAARSKALDNQVRSFERDPEIDRLAIHSRRIARPCGRAMSKIKLQVIDILMIRKNRSDAENVMIES